ncbi:MAG: hypothetical protein Q9214_003969 [Letrouitia sp. 1 TL-2023]
MKPLVLHAHTSGPNPYKVGIVLESLKIPYEVKLWEFGDGENGLKGPVFTKINENGRVPALEDPNTGVVSWESGAVINYILRNYDKSNTLQPGPAASEQDRVDAEKWIYFLVSTLGPHMGQVNWFTHFNSVKNDDARQRYEAQSYRCFGLLEAQLKKSGGKSILPAGFNAVDCHFYPWVNLFKFAQLDMSNYPLIQGWLKTVGERSDVKAAYKKIPEGEHAESKQSKV